MALSGPGTELFPSTFNSSSSASNSAFLIVMVSSTGPGAPESSTLNTPIMRMSSCSRLWQWKTNLPGKVLNLMKTSASKSPRRTVSFFAASWGAGGLPFIF